MNSVENKIETNIKKMRRGKLVFASDFSYLGNSEAVFKALQRLQKSGLLMHTSEVRNLSYKSKLLMLIVSDLREIGDGKVTPQQLEIIKSHFSHISEQELHTDIQLMPIWVRKILLSI